MANDVTAKAVEPVRGADRLTILLFLFALAVPVFCQVFGIDLKAAAEDEKRATAPFPSFQASLDGVRAFPREFDAWFMDNFGLRRALIRLHSSIVYFGLRSSPASKIIVGRDGWLYYDATVDRNGADSVADFRGTRPLTPMQLENWRWLFQDQHDWFAARGIKFLMVLVPSKEAIHPEHLPGWMTRLTDKTAMEQMTDHLRAKAGFEWVDVTGALQDGRKRERVYLKTDTHWNRYGGYCGYRAIMAPLTNMFPAVVLPPDADFKLGYWEIPGGDLAQIMSLRPLISEENVIMTPARSPRANPVPYGGRDLPDLLSELPDTNLPRAIVYRDSFAQDLIPYLSEHFQRVVYSWARQGIENRLLKEEKPDVVIHILSDRLLRMGIRYPVEMRDEAARKRFEASTNNMLAVADLASVENGEVSRTVDGWVVKPQGEGARVTLGSVAGAKEFLPIVRASITVPRKTEIRLLWQVRGEMRNARAHLIKGRNDVLLPLTDPELASDLWLETGLREGEYTLHSLEIRGVPR